MIKEIIKVLLVTSAISFSGCGYAANNKESEAGKTMIDLNNMKDWCTGRYTFKIPKDAKMIDESMNYDSFKIESRTNATKADFEQAVAAGIADYNDGYKLFLEETPVEYIDNKIVKIFWGKLSKKRPNLGTTQVFGYVLDRGVLFLIKGGYSDKFKKESRDGIKYLVKNLRAHDNNKIPLEKGICLKNGFVKDDGKIYKFTKQTVGFEFVKAPSVLIKVETQVIYKNEVDLITRITENLKKTSNSKAFSSTVKDIRKGERSTSQQPPTSGLEWVLEVPMEGGTAITASWEHQGTIKSPMDPLISLGVDSDRNVGGVKMASIPNTTTLKMYEAILNSIRKF